MLTLASSSFLLITNTNTSASAQLQDLQLQDLQLQDLQLQDLQLQDLQLQGQVHGQQPYFPQHNYPYPQQIEQQQSIEQQMQQHLQPQQMIPSQQNMHPPSTHQQPQQLLPGQLPMTEHQKQSLQNQLYSQQSKQPQANPTTNEQRNELPSNMQLDQRYLSSFQSSSASPTPHTSGNDLNAQAISNIQNLSQDEHQSAGPSIAISGSIVYIAWVSIDSSTRANTVLYTRSLNGGASFEPVKTISNNGNNPSIAVEGNVIHLVYDDYNVYAQNTGEIYYTRSTDAGVTFPFTTNISHSPGGNSYDPSIAKSGSNNIHVVWIENIPDVSSTIFYNKSSNGGNNWESTGRPITVNQPGQFSAALAVSGSNIHVVWEQYDSSGTQRDIWYAKSTDGGAKFTASKNISNTSDDSARPSIVVSGANILHVVWMDYVNTYYPEIYYSRSPDNGNVFEQFKNISNTYDGSYSPSIMASGNVLYVVWQDNSTLDGAGEIYFTKSTDGGNTFAYPINISNTQLQSWAPKLPEGGSNGGFYVTWQEVMSSYSSNTDILFVYEKGVTLTTNALSAKKPSSTFTISGTLNEKGTGTPIPNQQISFSGSTGLTSIPSSVTTASDGTFKTSATAGTSEGSYQIKIRYGGGQGYASVVATRTLNIDKTVPEVRITSPANGATFTAPASITVRADAADKLFSTSTTFDGKIRNLEFLYKRSDATTYILIRSDSTSPYSATVYNLPTGSYNIIARAYDEAGNRKTSSTITVSVR